MWAKLSFSVWEIDSLKQQTQYPIFFKYPQQDTLRDTVKYLLQFHKIYVDCLGKLPRPLQGCSEGMGPVFHGQEGTHIVPSGSEVLQSKGAEEHNLAWCCIKKTGVTSVVRRGWEILKFTKVVYRGQVSVRGTQDIWNNFQHIIEPYHVCSEPTDQQVSVLSEHRDSQDPVLNSKPNPG